MTALTLTMPRLGETMEEGLIVGWMVAPGQAFKRGEPILELETDKTVVEFPALGDGVIDEVLAGPGDRIAVGQPIARAQVGNAADWAETTAENTAAAETVPEAPAAPVAPAAVADRAPGGPLRATPLARRAARAGGVALDSIAGTGRRGRIERADVERALAAPTAGDLQTQAQPGGRLAYRQAGSGAQTVLLVHGFAGDSTAWAQVAAALARTRRRVVMPDLPGHGATTISAEAPEALAAAVAALAGSLPGRVTLVGHSLGAQVAVEAALRLPGRVDRVVLLTPAGCGPRINADFVHGMAAAGTPGEVAHLLRLLGPKGGTLSDKALAQMAAQMAEGRLRALADALCSEDGRQRIDLLRPLVRLAAEVPVAALFGTEDRVVPATDALNLPLPVAAHFLPCGHMPQWDAPREVAEFILGETGHD